MSRFPLDKLRTFTIISGVDEAKLARVPPRPPTNGAALMEPAAPFNASKRTREDFVPPHVRILFSLLHFLSVLCFCFLLKIA